MAQKLLPQTILFMDDDPQIRQLGGELLPASGVPGGHRAERAQALEVFHRLEKVDLVILDSRIPGWIKFFQKVEEPDTPS